MKVTAILIALILVISGVLLMQDREGRFYKKVTKLVRPLQSTPAISEWVAQPYAGGFSELVKSDDWRWYQPELLTSELEKETLKVSIQKENVWWKNWRGPMFYNHIKGDADVSVTVKTRKLSDENSIPDIAYQFGGLILRDPMGDKALTSESYVFNVVGHRGEEGLQVETKSTQDGWSDVEGHDWPTSDAELRILRQGYVFELFARGIGEDKWKMLVRYERPDLPEVLQLGIIAYAYSAWSGYHDLSASFDNLLLDVPVTGVPAAQ